VRRNANFAPLSQILVVLGCEGLRSETRKYRLSRALRTFVWSQRCVRCDRRAEVGVRRVHDASSVCVQRILLGQVGEVEVERAQDSHDRRPTDASVAVLELG